MVCHTGRAFPRPPLLDPKGQQFPRGTARRVHGAEGVLEARRRIGDEVHIETVGIIHLEALIAIPQQGVTLRPYRLVG